MTAVLVNRPGKARASDSKETKKAGRGQAHRYYPTEGSLLVSELLEGLGVSRGAFSALPVEKRHEVAARLRDILAQPAAQQLLLERKGRAFGAAESVKLREILGLKKWYELRVMVAYIRTMVASEQQAVRGERFSRQVNTRIDAEDVRRVLSRINDVMPARIDTDIRHQSSQFYRAVVELVSNAVDASIKSRSPIGRFGIGFYQILNHLKDPADRVIVSTRVAGHPAGVKIEFRNRSGQIEIAVQEDASLPASGTRVEVRSKEFEASKAEALVQKHFTHTQDVDFRINGSLLKRWIPDNYDGNGQNHPLIEIELKDGSCITTDRGCGMSPATVFEKLLVPKLSNKPPVYELREKGELKPKLYFSLGKDENQNEPEVVVQVGGIAVEHFRVAGRNTAGKVVVELPPSTFLGEQRDEVSIDELTVAAMKDVIRQAVSQPTHTCFKILNSLVVACQDMQRRSLLCHREDNLIVFMREEVARAFPGFSFLPNEEKFENLSIDPNRTALLNPEILQSDPELVSGLARVTNWVSSGKKLFTARFNPSSTQGAIVAKDFIILDERTPLERDTDLVEKAVSKIAGWGNGSLLPADAAGTDETDQRAELRKTSSFQALTADLWECLSFGSLGIALREARLLEHRRPELVKVFSEKLLSILPKGSLTEGWTILRHYVLSDERNDADIFEEIEALSQSVRSLLEDPHVLRVLNTFNVPLFSMFENRWAELPPHIREYRESAKGTATIKGRTYLAVERRDNAHEFMREEGDIIRTGTAGDLLYKDGEVTVYKNRAVNTKTGENITLAIPGLPDFLRPEFELREISLDSEFSGRTGERKAEEPPPSLKVTTADGHNAEIKEGKLFIGGEEKAFFSGIDVPLKEILVTKSGELRLIAHNISGCFIASKDKAVPEQCCLLNEKGEILWQYREEDWGARCLDVPGEKLRNQYGRDERREDVSRLAHCLIIPHDGVIDDDAPLLRVYRYALGAYEHRAIDGYITASGREARISGSSEVNEQTLLARYALENHCGCCSLDSPPFQIGYCRDDTVPDLSSVLPNIRRLPVTVKGAFRFDDAAEEWLAPAYDNDGWCLAVFDKQGEFLRAERVGPGDLCHASLDQDSTDFRDLEGYYAKRLPEEAKIYHHDNYVKTKADYERLLRGRVHIGKSGTTLRRSEGSYSSKPFRQEKNALREGLLGISRGVISKAQAEVLGTFLAGEPRLDHEKLERLFYRVFKHRALSPEDLRLMLPVLYEMEDLRPITLSPEIVKELGRFSHLGPDRFVQIVRCLDLMLPDDAEKAKPIAAKFLRFYSEKMMSESVSSAEDFIYAASAVKTFEHECLRLSAFGLIRYGRTVELTSLPREIRPLITFLQHDEDDLAIRDFSGIRVPEEKGARLRLAEVIQWKRLREGLARNFDGDPRELEIMVKTAVAGKDLYPVLREITHAIHFQALNSTDLFIRELVQNSVDVMRLAGVPGEERQVFAELGVNDAEELIFSFSDPVGMNISTFINYFLVPGESTKLDGKSIGFYGQGVFTLFKDAREVLIKTGTGDGNTWYVTMKPIIEHSMVVDVEIEFRCAEENFKGTAIQRIQQVHNPYVEAAYIQNSVLTLTGALDREKAVINLQGTPVNSNFKKLAVETVSGKGEVTVYRNQNNIVTQHGLFVKEIREYQKQLPGFISEALRNWGGVVVDLPPSVELTRSRQDVANKDKTAEWLDPAVERCLFRAYLASVGEKLAAGEFEFPQEVLPYDYFSRPYPIPWEIKADANALMRGETLDDIDYYLESSHMALLLCALPLIEIGERKMSLADLQEAYLSKKRQFPFDKANWKDELPWWILRLIEEHSAGGSGRGPGGSDERKEKILIPDCPLDKLLELAPEELKGWIREHWEELEALDAFSAEFLKIVGEAFRQRDIAHLFYESSEGSFAHAHRLFGFIAWNLCALKNEGAALKALVSRPEGGEKAAEKRSEVISLLEVLIHEFAHTVERLDAWTHNSSFEALEGRVLLQLLQRGGAERLLG